MCNQWIAVGDRLPDDTRWVNIYTPRLAVAAGFIEDGTWYMLMADAHLQRVEPSYWQHLPTPPSEA